MPPSERHPRSSADDRALREIRGWIEDRLGIAFPEDREDLLFLRLTQVCRRLDIHDVVELHAQLIQGGASQLRLEVADAASTNHTYFFRGKDTLARLRQQIPSLAVGRGPIRVWCAAVSTGDEAYTVAMIFADALGLDRAREQVSILGTDVSGQNIRRAERGVYSERSLRLVPPDIRARFLVPSAMGQHQVAPPIRSLCTFRRLNLMSAPWPFRQSFHVILLRNALYYWAHAQQEDVVRRMADHVVAGGMLLTSVTETIRALDTPWTTIAPGCHQIARSPSHRGGA